ncbi:MAG: GGDEF domain-containing protein [Pseudomonadota bacterium]
MELKRSDIVVLVFVGCLVLTAVLATFTAASLVSGATIGSGTRIMLGVIAALAASCAAFAYFAIYPMVRRFSEEKVEIAAKSETYRNAALTDSLTGLQNRRYFDDTLKEYMREFAAIGKTLGIVIIDLDFFKRINDTYGHDNGDLGLRAVSICLQQQVRGHDILARLGGEEFAIVFPNVDEFTLAQLAERVRGAIEQIHLVLDGERVNISASIGGALWDGTENMNTLVKRADKHLYAAKHNGRNQVVMSENANFRPAGGAARSQKSA